jgi:hypothetical protein
MTERRFDLCTRNIPSCCNCHSIVSGHHNPLNFKRKISIMTVYIRLPVRQISSLLISKGNSQDSNLARLRQVSASIGRFRQNVRQVLYGRRPEKRPSPLIDQRVRFVMIAVATRLASGARCFPPVVAIEATRTSIVSVPSSARIGERIIARDFLPM